MRSNRGNRNTSRRRVRSLQVRLSPGENSDKDRDGYPLEAKQNAAKFIESARTSFPCLLELSDQVHIFPADLQTDAFNVFFEHLRVPAEEKRCKDERCDGIMASLKGIEKLGSKLYFSRDADHNQRFIECWPHIFKWLKALQDVRLVYDRMGWYSSVAGETFFTCLSVHSSALEDDEVLEFAVRAWIGVEGRDGKDHYTGRSLLSCILAFLKKDGIHFGGRAPRVKRALLACNIDAENLVNKLIARLEVASSPMNVSKTVILTDLMANLIWLRSQFFITSTLKHSVGKCVVSYLKALVDDPPADHGRAINSALAIFDASLSYQTVNYGVTLIQEGILLLLLRVASTSSECEDLTEPTSFASLTSSVLQHLHLCLIFDTMIHSCREALRSLYDGDRDVKDMLTKSPKRFREIWMTFETVLLEHAVLLYLFEGLYAPEDGICANRTCRKVGFRGEFKKCAGCAFALYCSHSCQKTDWTSHRIGCKDMGDEGVSVIQDHLNRFPRKIATVQINRLWKQVVALAKRKNIPLEDVAVRISCSEIPFELEVINYHSLLKGDGKNSHLALVANELKRQKVESRREWIIVVLSLTEMEYPFLVHIDDMWTRGVTNGILSKIKKSTIEREPKLFVDQRGNALSCGKVDALRAGVWLAKTYADDWAETVWDEDVLVKAAEDVLEDFQDIIGSFEFGPAFESVEE